MSDITSTKIMNKENLFTKSGIPSKKAKVNYSETETYKEYENWVKEWEYDDTTGMGYFEYQIEWLNSIFKLPDIPIILGECEEINAWYYYEDNPSYSVIKEIANYKSQHMKMITLNQQVDFILYHE